MANVKAFAALVVIPMIFLGAPLQALGAALPAGFAPGSVWLSDHTPAAGSTVRIFTVIYDSSSTAIEGSVSFKIDGESVGSSPFSLEPGESSIESVTWVALEGNRSVSVEIVSAIDKKTKQAVSVANTSASPLSVSVGAPLPKPPALEAIDSAQTVVASSSPIVATVVAGATSATESIRKAGESYLESIIGVSGATTTASTTKPRGSVLGAETEIKEEVASSTDPNPDGYLQKIAKVLLPVFKYPALFYPLFLFIILFVLWIVAKRLRNPKRK